MNTQTSSFATCCTLDPSEVAALTSVQAAPAPSGGAFIAPCETERKVTCKGTISGYFHAEGASLTILEMAQRQYPGVSVKNSYRDGIFKGLLTYNITGPETQVARLVKWIETSSF